MHWPQNPELFNAVTKLCNVMALLGPLALIWLHGWVSLVWLLLSLVTFGAFIVGLSEQRPERLCPTAIATGFGGLALIALGGIAFALG